MIRKAFALVFGFALLMSTVTARAQQQTKIPRIGFLTAQATASSGGNISAFRQGLRELGYIEGKNIVIEFRGAEGNLDRMPELAAELVSLGVDIIVTTGMPAVHAAKRATSTIPIVTATADNLVEAGIVASLARPGGNITGTSRVDADFSAKRVELLKETFPKLSRLAALSHGSLGSDAEELRETQAAGQAKGIQTHSWQIQDPGHFVAAYAEMKKKRIEALVIYNSSFTGFHRPKLLDLAAKNRLATMCGSATWTENGCLMSYGPNSRYSYYRAAYFVDKILKGAKPADLPVERPRKYELIINLKTAAYIGKTIPASVLARADRVIK